jgi:hypothetical protein
MEMNGEEGSDSVCSKAKATQTSCPSIIGFAMKGMYFGRMKLKMKMRSKGTEAKARNGCGRPTSSWCGVR